jgi:peptidoglycan/xylan/chitin deacetylase (PgdA/CDA1 family)
VPDILVLCYHAISRRWSHELAVDPDALERQLRLLLDRGYRAVRFADITRPDGAARRLAVTFDDAYRSVAEHALPVLARLGVPGTVFVPTAHVGSPQPMSWPGIDDVARGPEAGELCCMTWGQLEDLAHRGWEIGSHTSTHPYLTRCDDAALACELEGSRAAIAERLGACATIAYPYGDVDGRVMAAARRAGYELAAALPARLNRPTPMAWPRVGVYPIDAPWRFRLKVSRPLRAFRAALPGGVLTEDPPS